MKLFFKIFSGLAVSLVPMVATAGYSSSVTVSWSRADAGATAVPTLSFYAVIALVILLSLLAVHMLKKHQRNIALVLFAGITASSITYYTEPDARPELINTGCSGNTTTPKTLKNTCEASIRVSYSGQCTSPGNLVCAPLAGCAQNGAVIAPMEEKDTLTCELPPG